jgi:hypothetical protein
MNKRLKNTSAATTNSSINDTVNQDDIPNTPNSQQDMTVTTKAKNNNSVIVSVKNLAESSEQVDEVTVCNF